MTPEEKIVSAAVVWYTSCGPLGPVATDGTPLGDLADAVDEFLDAQKPRQLTWGQVPAGWSVLAPDGRWYEVTATHRTGTQQHVTLKNIGPHPRDPQGPVTARPGAGGATDAALSALGYPEILEDGP